ncbi:ACT domain-containing protein [Tepidanaerobacter sp. GT38]|nr:ACT domain-containing protein [Tepidanaerobacter sp. GT38]MCG1011369.1 ACT domain-containing protein [Tepidanaerobacter sp. GT38]
MEILVTLDVLKQHSDKKVVKFPPNTLVTKEARIYAAKNGIELFIGDEKVSEPANSNGTPSVRAVISVIGEDRVGIIAGISDVLAKANVNILDITQTAIEGLFTMIMVVDIAKSTVSFDELKNQLAQRGQELSVRVDAQREEIFHFMHRI